jgi:two-component system sensor histidine kinase KdpD
VTLGRGAAVLASVLSVLLFDIFFVPPRFSLAVSNIQYLVTFAVMLATGLITGQLAAGLKQKAHEAEIREQRTKALYEIARDLAGALTLEQVIELAQSFVRRQLAAEAHLLPADEYAHLQPAGNVDLLLVRMASDSGLTVRRDELSGDGHASLYLPLCASMRTRGVLAVAFPAEAPAPPDDNLALLEALASLVAIALERLHYAVPGQTRVTGNGAGNGRIHPRASGPASQPGRQPARHGPPQCRRNQVAPRMAAAGRSDRRQHQADRGRAG